MSGPSGGQLSALEALTDAFVEHGKQAGAGADDALIDVEDILAVIALAQPPGERPTDDTSLVLLGRFAARAGVDQKAGADGAQQAIARYLERRPLKMELLARVGGALRETLAQGGVLEKGVARLIGGSDASGVLGGAARPEGTVPAGPMARFLTQKK